MRFATVPFNDPRDVPCPVCEAKVGVRCSSRRMSFPDRGALPKFHRSRVDDVVVMDYERARRGGRAAA